MVHCSANSARCRTSPSFFCIRFTLGKIVLHLAKPDENVVLFPAVNLTAIPWDFSLILAVLAVVIPWRGAVRVGRLMRRSNLGSSDRLGLYGSTIASQWVIAGIVLWRALDRGMDRVELGLTISDPWRTAWMTVALTLLLCAGQLAGLRKMARIPLEDRGTLFRLTERIVPRTMRETIAFAALAITAGISEEFLYRGFTFAAFERLFAGTAAPVIYAGCVSSLWFAAAHLYQGRRGVITTFVVGICFVSVLVWSGNLLPAVVAHTTVDMAVGICVPRLTRKP